MEQMEQHILPSVDKCETDSLLALYQFVQRMENYIKKLFFGDTPVAYGKSWARGQVRTVAGT